LFNMLASIGRNKLGYKVFITSTNG